MVPAQRLKSMGRSAVGLLTLLSAFAAGRQDAPKLKIGERLMDGAVAVKAADLKTGAESFRCADDGCVAVRAGGFSFASEGGEKSGLVLAPAVRVTVEIGGRTKELAANLEFDKDLVASLKAPVGAKIVVEPLGFVDAAKTEIPALAESAASAKLPFDYAVQISPVRVKILAERAVSALARGGRTVVSWDVDGALLLPDEARVEVYADPEAGKSPAAFRKPSGRWQDRSVDQPLRGNVEAMFLSPGARNLRFEVRVGDQIVASEPLRFDVAEPKLRLELKNAGRRVGDIVEIAAFADDKPLDAASLSQESTALTDSLRSVGARYRLFGNEERDEDARFSATEIRIAPVPIERPLPQIGTVAFKSGLSAGAEPLRPTVLPILLRAGDREIDADPSDLRSFEVVQDLPGVLSPVKVVTTGSTSLGLSFTPLKAEKSANLTVKYRGREIATLIVQVEAGVKSGRLSGKFLPLEDEDVARLYGDEVAKAYHVIECTLTNTVEEGKSDVIVQPEGIEFGAVVQSRGKKGGWRIASANATSAAILPGGALGLSGFTIGSVLDVDDLRGFFQNSGKSSSPTVVRLLAKHLPKELPEDREHWADALNTAVADMVASLDWDAFAAAYGYSDAGLQSGEKGRLVRRRLQIDTNEAVIGGEFNYVRWRPLSPEAVNEVFQVLSRRKGERKTVQIAQLFLSAGRLIGNAGLMGDGGKGIVSGIGVASGLLPTIKQTLPELSEARRRTLASMLFAGPLRLSPQVPVKKHIFVSKEVMKYMFNADETRISEIVQGSLTADVAIVTSSERTTIGSTGP